MYSTYVVYPAALFDGWEVTKEGDQPVSFDAREEAIAYARAQAVLEGGAIVRLENWFGDVERTVRVQPAGWELESTAAPASIQTDRQPAHAVG